MESDQSPALSVAARARGIWLLFAQAVTIVLAAALALGAVWRPFLAQPPPGAARGGDSYASAARRAAPWVVGVFDRESQAARRAPGDIVDIENVGSGVIVSPDGFIVTNYHVVAASEIDVALTGGEVYPARIVAVDPALDLALLKIDAARLQAADFLQDGARLEVGDVVLALGNPFGLRDSVSMGIVSALDRRGLGLAEDESFIQVDAAINPGSSGGALINARGELVGINSALFASQQGFAAEGINFAIPIVRARDLYRRIAPAGGDNADDKNGFDKNGFAVALAPRGESFADKWDSNSLLITRVAADSPAAASGAQAGDFIVSVAGAAPRADATIGGQIIVRRGARLLTLSAPTR